jgi:hypothetical protein
MPIIFLIEYNRNLGQIVTLERFLDSERQDAEDKRFEIELKLHQSGIEHEVILLEASSEAALRRTHRRYFEDIRQLATLP